MEPLGPDRHTSSEGNSNPYATPNEVEFDFEIQKALAPYQTTRAPWMGGWKLVTLIVMGFTLVLMAGGNTLGNFSPLTSVFGLPILGLTMLAVIVRALHSQVIIDRLSYGLASLGFGFASFVCFVPVCVAVGVPAFALADSVRNSVGSTFILGAALFVSITICGLLFVAFLRLYFNAKYRSQTFRELQRSAGFDPNQLHATTNPWTTHAVANKPSSVSELAARRPQSAAQGLDPLLPPGAESPAQSSAPVPPPSSPTRQSSSDRPANDGSLS